MIWVYDETVNLMAPPPIDPSCVANGNAVTVIDDYAIFVYFCQRRGP